MYNHFYNKTHASKSMYSEHYTIIYLKFSTQNCLQLTVEKYPQVLFPTSTKMLTNSLHSEHIYATWFASSFFLFFCADLGAVHRTKKGLLNTRRTSFLLNPPPQPPQRILHLRKRNSQVSLFTSRRSSFRFPV